MRLFEKFCLLGFAAQGQGGPPLNDRLTRHSLFLASVAEVFVRGGVAGVQFEGLVILGDGAVVVAQEKEESADVQIEAREKRVELAGSFHLGDRFLIASE